jgi:signal transduction histidine kinase
VVSTLRNLQGQTSSPSTDLNAPSRRQRSSIRVRLTFPFLLITIAVAGLGILVVTRLVAGSIEERLANQLADSGQTAAQSVVEIEQLHLASLRLMVNTVDIELAVISENGTLLEDIILPLAINQGIDRTLVLDASGATLYQLDASDDGSIEPVDASNWPGTRAALAGRQDEIGDKYIELINHTDGSVFYTIAPVTSDDGEVLGAILVGTTVDNMVRFLNNQAISQIAVFDLDGNPLASTLPAGAVTPLISATVEMYIEQGQTTNTIGTLNVDGVDYQTLFTPLRIRNEIVGLTMVALPSDFIVDRLSVSRNTFAALFVTFFFVVLGVGLWTSRSILVPLDRLVSTTRQIRSGNLDERVKLTNNDELGELGNSFDEMTDALVLRNQRINRLYRKQLAETARRDAILESIGDAVLVLNPDGSEYLRNEAMAILFSKAITNKEDFAKLSQMLETPQYFAETQIFALGSNYYSGLARQVIAKDRSIGYVLVFRDITDIIEAENSKDEIMQQISHELRTPLSAIYGYIELLGMFNQFDDQSAEYLRNANHHISELQYMINQVVEVTAILSQRFQLSVTTFDIVDLLDTLLSQQEPKFNDKQLTLRVAAPPSLMVQADERRLLQTLEHILNNARQYTLAGGQIWVQLGLQQNHVVIQVQDTGVGIKEDEIERVFDRMYRGSAADAGATDSRGLGVGLFISREIIRMHNGDIQIASQTDRGTTVQVTLPRTVEEQRAVYA